ncbi:hypothetical protein GCM10009733_062780 [Nonomuraea maheshkhaliensis]|uniref:DUF397 domain-containing protein n=1 Tax=Nonomuraea maheshkhaliensis TaxID=419590 RepID=A0ABP4RP55_9ACTN
MVGSRVRDRPRCEDLRTISDDDGAVTELHAPKPLKAALRRLREANKAVARKEPGSGSSHLQGGLVRIERVAG